MLGIARDITALRQAEDALKKVNRAARAGKGLDYLDHTHMSWADDPTGQGPSGIALRARAGVQPELHDQPDHAALARAGQ